MSEIMIIGFFVIIFAAALIGLLSGIIKLKPVNGDTQSSSRETPAQVINKATNLDEIGQLSKAIKILEDFTKRQPDEVSVRLLLGDFLLKKNQPVKAEKQYKHVLKIKPANLDALERISDCYSLIGRYDKAVEGYAEILKKSHDNCEIREKLGDVYVGMNNSDQAIIEYRTILSKDLYNIQVKKKLADLFFSTGEYKRAINEYEDIINVDGVSAAVLKRIAKAHCLLEKFVDAALVYRKIIALDETDVAAYKELAELYIKIESYEKAAKIYSLMLEKNLDVSQNILVKLAEIYVWLGDYDKALSIGNKILTENYRNIYILEIIGEAYRRQGKYESAIQNFKKLIEEETKEKRIRHFKNIISSILCDWGNEYFNKKEFQAALDKFVEAIQYDPNNSEIYCNLGKTNSQIKNYDSALSHFRKALELSNFDPKMYKIIAELYEDLGQNDLLIELYYDAAKKYPDNHEVRNALGVSLRTAGFYPQAENELMAAISINPENPNSYYNLGLVQESQKNFDKAKENYKKTLDLDPNHEEARNNFNILMGRDVTGEVDEDLD